MSDQEGMYLILNENLLLFLEGVLPGQIHQLTLYNPSIS